MKKFIIILCTLIMYSSYGQEKDPTVCTTTCDKCDKAIEACMDIVRAQDQKLKDDKNNIKDLEDMVVDEKGKEAALPWWVYLSVGAAGGVIGGPVGLGVLIIGTVGGVVKEELR